MNFTRLEQLEARAQRLCFIEREDARDRGRSAGGPGQRSDSTGGGGAGAKALVAKSHTSALEEARQEQKSLNKARATQPSSSKKTEGGNGPGGGTTVTDKYVPGAVPNYPDAANPARNLLEGLAVGPLGPLGTATTLIGGAAKVLAGDDMSKSPFTDTGPQRGWLPDRYRGAPSLGGIGGSGGAVSDDAGLDREIAGRPIRTETKTSTDDETDAGPLNSGNDAYSDLMLKDRRKPVASLQQMLEAML